MTVPNTAPQTMRSGVWLMPRVGIIVPDLEMLNHYKGIILNMPPQSTCVVTGWNPSSGNNAVAEFARSHGYITMPASRAYETGVRFNILVSHHTHVVPSSDILTDLGDTQVRLMYGLGKSEWNFSAWNRHYDTALCWGPYHARNLAERYPDIKLIEVGYPRFDPYFNGSLNRQKILESLGCDPAKPVVVWLPTWTTLSSVTEYSDAIAALQKDYNLLVKLHPGTYGEPHNMEILRQNGIPLLQDRYYDNVQLFSVADYVLADYGGSPFGAIYTGKRLLLLNVGAASEHHHTGADSLDIKLREWVLNINPDKRFEIGRILADDSIWDAQLSRYEEARRELFAPQYGTASRTAAHALVNMLLVKLVARIRQLTGEASS